jgi:hypothetical protein
VAPPIPLQGIYAAVTRSTLDGKNPNGWVPSQKIDVFQSLKAYTSHANYAAFQENIKGTNFELNKTQKENEYEKKERDQRCSETFIQVKSKRDFWQTLLSLTKTSLHFLTITPFGIVLCSTLL